MTTEGKIINHKIQIENSGIKIMKSTIYKGQKEVDGAGQNHIKCVYIGLKVYDSI